MKPSLLLLLLLPCCWGAADAQLLLKGITLSIEPSNDVARDTNVTLRCRTDVSSSGREAVNRQYNIYKNKDLVYSGNSSSSEDFLYRLPQVRVSNNGKYQCQVTIEDKSRTSDNEKLTVTDLAIPELHVNRGVVNEGEELTARCTAPGEEGVIIFYLFDDSKEIQESQVSTDHAEFKRHFTRVGIHKIHCTYTVVLTADTVRSEKSNSVTVSVKELQIKPVLEIFPQSKIFEGDRLDISCAVEKPPFTSLNIKLYLSQGNQLLRSEFSETRVNHSMVALAKDFGAFECRLQTTAVDKFVTKTVSVTELFSVPTITMTPAEVFQRSMMTITCKSESFAHERIRREDLTYSLDPPENLLSKRSPGMFTGWSLMSDFNYTCVAKAKGIVKHSKTLTVHPKIAVSVPKILVVDRAILGRPFRIKCKSDIGSLPINYTLVKEYDQVDTISISLLHQEAYFTVTVTQPEEISKYMCEAKNSQRDGQLSKRLNATVIVPLSQPTLTVIPTLSEISEGDQLYLICGVKGSPPVTFKWYRVGAEKPVYTTISNSNNTHYQIPMLTRDHSGTYFCEGHNYANNLVRSSQVTIQVRLAMWKKALIGGFCLLLLVALVTALVLRFKSRRARVDRSHSVWSERPHDAEAPDEENSMASNEPDVEYTEVVHPRAPDATRVPPRKGTDTVYSELQNAAHGADDHYDYGSVEYAELNGEQPGVGRCPPEVSDYQDLPEPVD